MHFHKHVLIGESGIGAICICTVTVNGQVRCALCVVSTSQPSRPACLFVEESPWINSCVNEMYKRITGITPNQPFAFSTNIASGFQKSPSLPSCLFQLPLHKTVGS
jgi:hypothetical protein